jgi:hypothetical protein
MLLNPLAYVLEDIKPIEQHETFLLDVKLKNSGAMVALMRGTATKKDMDALIAMANITEALQRLGFGKEYGEVCVEGRVAILSIVTRAVQRLKFIPTGPEIQALNKLMELHDAQMEVITVKDMGRAIDLAKRLLRAKQAAPLAPVPKELM